MQFCRGTIIRLLTPGTLIHRRPTPRRSITRQYLRTKRHAIAANRRGAGIAGPGHSCRMQASLVRELSHRRGFLRARWEDLLRAEPVTSPLGLPDALVHLIDVTLEEIFAALADGPCAPRAAGVVHCTIANGRPRSGRPTSDHHCRILRCVPSELSPAAWTGFRAGNGSCSLPWSPCVGTKTPRRFRRIPLPPPQPQSP